MIVRGDLKTALAVGFVCLGAVWAVGVAIYEVIEDIRNTAPKSPETQDAPETREES